MKLLFRCYLNGIFLFPYCFSHDWLISPHNFSFIIGMHAFSSAAYKGHECSQRAWIIKLSMAHKVTRGTLAYSLFCTGKLMELCLDILNIFSLLHSEMCQIYSTKKLRYLLNIFFLGNRNEIQDMPLNLKDTTWRFPAQYRLLLKIHKNISVMDKKYEEKTYYTFSFLPFLVPLH